MSKTNWILTASGNQFNFEDLASNTYTIEEISSALSKACRFGGHCKSFYSVAQHSVLCADLIPEAIDFMVSKGADPDFFYSEEYDGDAVFKTVMLHDGTEAYIGDMVRPLKHLASMLPFVQIEDRIHEHLRVAFGLESVAPIYQQQITKLVDNMALKLEKKLLLPEHPASWGLEGIPDTKLTFEPLNPDEAKEFFLDRWAERKTNLK